MNTITPANQLAHNIVRLMHWSDGGLIRNCAISCPRSVSAIMDFIKRPQKEYNVEDDGAFWGLGDIAQRSMQATLNMIAYDPGYNIVMWVDQYVDSYLSSPRERAQFIGAHVSRPYRLAQALHGLSVIGRVPNFVQVDRAIADVARAEVIMVDTHFNAVVEAHKHVSFEVIDSQIKEERTETFYV